VLLSLREESLARLDRFKAWIPRILDNYLRLDRLTRASGREAIVRPLERWGELGGEAIEAEAALVEAVLDQVSAGRIRGETGGEGEVATERAPAVVEAPYLQLVLDRLWTVERAAGSSRMRAATLEELGGAARIVAAHLEQAMDALEPRERDVAAALLRQLVTPSGTKIAHAPSDLAGYADLPEQETRRVLVPLARSRILRAGEDGRYEIFHDVLAAPVLAWVQRHRQEQALAAARRRSRRLVLVAVASLFALGLVSAAAVWALVERENAQEQAREAKASELIASAAARLEADPELSLLLALEAARREPSPAAGTALRDALQLSRVRAILPAGGPVLDARYSPDSRLLATASEDGLARIYTTTGFRRIAALQHDAEVTHVRFAGRDVVTATPRAVTVWSPGRWEARRSLRAPAPVADLEIATCPVSPDPCAYVAAGREILAWSTRTGRVVARVLQEVPAGTLDVAGARAASGGTDRFVRVFDMALERRTRTLDLGSRVDGLLLLGRGTLVAAGGANGATRVWDGRTGATVAALPPRTQGGVVDIAPGARPAQLVLASADGVARVWNFRLQGAEALLQLRPGHANHLTSVDTAGTLGFFVLSASEDTTARVSDGDKGRQLWLLAGHTAPVVRAEFARDGRTALTASLDGTARVWDPGIRPDLEPSRRQPPSDPALVARSPDGTVTATVQDEVVVLEDGSRRELRGHTAAVNAVDFSPDGRLLVSAGRDGDARVWDVATGEPALLLRGHFGSVADARFSPDGRWIVTAGPISAGLWSTTTGELVTYLYGPTGPDAASFAGDGSTIVTREPDGTVREYDCELCARLPGLVALAEARLAASERRLTEEERAAYLG
jgi:hypothetical protein